MKVSKMTVFLAAYCVVVLLLIGMFFRSCNKTVEHMTTPQLDNPTLEYPVIFYEESNYNGKASPFNKDSLSKIRKPQRVSSMKILDGMKLVITHHCNNVKTATVKTYDRNQPKMNICAPTTWFNIRVSGENKTTFELIGGSKKTQKSSSSPALSELSQEYPVALYTGESWTGNEIVVKKDGALNIDNQLVKSVRVKDGFALMLKNHQCVKKDGCTNDQIIPLTVRTEDDETYSPCSSCSGLVVMKNTLSISPWYTILRNLPHTRDNQLFKSNSGLVLNGSLSGTQKGVYVAYYEHYGDAWRPLIELDGSKPPAKSPAAVIQNQGHYNEAIMNEIDFDTWVIYIKRNDNGHSGTYEFRRSDYPNHTKVTDIMWLTNRRIDGKNTLESPRWGVLMIAGNREIWVRVEKRNP